MFQPTHPHGVRLFDLSPLRRSRIRFNPRTRTGCDQAGLSFTSWITGFNPRTRTGCDRVGKPGYCSIFGSFNPRTRTGCDFALVGRRWLGWSFNPRTRTGCDISRSCRLTTTVSFNPRTRTGCDTGSPLPRSQQSVSTHAPARGATLYAGLSTLLAGGFNPRTRTGCDLQDGSDPVSEDWFQPTHPHGVRPSVS